jgi:hypothetical protein
MISRSKAGADDYDYHQVCIASSSSFPVSIPSLSP